MTGVQTCALPISIELYFADPWNCSKNPIVSAEGQKLLENTAVNQAVTAKVTVADNILDLNITAPEATLCINLAYIKIYMPEAEVPQEPTTEEPTTKEPVTDGQQNPPVQETTDEETTTGEDKTVKNPVKTGDNSKTNVYAILLCLSFAVMAAVILGKKKREVK